MVTGTGKSSIALIFLLAVSALSPSARASADMQQSVKLDLYNTVYSGEKGEEWEYAGAGRARLDLRSTGNRMVQGRLVMDAGVSDMDVTLFDISRASIRFRFPVGDEYLFRVTAGKERLAWGDGVFFNAGDVLFGSSTVSADFLSDTLRDETAWLLSGYFPLGQFSFFETVILPPQSRYLPETADTLSTDSASDSASDSTSAGMEQLFPGGPVSKTSSGFRFQFKPADIKTEWGYLYRGSEETHHPYISLQGHLLADWYISASTTAAAADDERKAVDSAKEAFTLSIGLLHILKPDPDSTLSLRLEALIRPAGEWKEVTEVSADTELPEYALFLFPEIVWNPSRTVTAYFRTVFSPVDVSAIFIPGVSWNIYQGFSILSFLSLQAGRENNIYSWSRKGGFSATTGFSYIY